jgi:transketolase
MILSRQDLPVLANEEQSENVAKGAYILRKELKLQLYYPHFYWNIKNSFFQ